MCVYVCTQDTPIVVYTQQHLIIIYYTMYDSGTYTCKNHLLYIIIQCMLYIERAQPMVYIGTIIIHETDSTKLLQAR